MLSRSPLCATFPYRGLKSARAFYAEKVGLKLVSGSVKDGFLEFQTGRGTYLMVFESDSKKSNDTGATFEVSNLAKEMETLRRKGVKFESYDLPGIKTVKGVAVMGPHKMAWFKDPGGNLLALHEGE